MFRPILTFVEAQSKIILLAAGLLLIGLIGLVDALTGPEIFFSIFYLVPIAIGAWGGGKWVGLLLSLVSGIVWHVADLTGGARYSADWIPYWNSATRLGFFSITALLIGYLREEMYYVQTLSGLDPLTGAANSRRFYEVAEREIERSRRYHHSLSLACIDLDNFKQVNDQLGHLVGDDLLCKVVKIFQENTRASDLVARLGGDEFAVLLPETDVQGANHCVAKIRERLLQAMRDQGWPVTCSIGIATFQKSPPRDVESMIHSSDELMYQAKNSGKNCTKHELIEEPAEVDGGHTQNCL